MRCHFISGESALHSKRTYAIARLVWWRNKPFHHLIFNLFGHKKVRGLLAPNSDWLEVSDLDDPPSQADDGEGGCRDTMTNERARARALCMNEYDRNIVSLLSKLFRGLPSCSQTKVHPTRLKLQRIMSWTKSTLAEICILKKLLVIIQLL